ncbi:MAG: BatA domain-containing protein, partial [Candidatus Eisenbacteria bacterium]|nr:BatA domain-containing protein [Candidatus Eisenbacteria bacterium]
MSGLFFLNGKLLFGLLAVAIPLVIHLFTKRRARRQEFSSVTFLRDIARRETRRLRVRNLLLMLLRMAAIAAFVLAVARPALRGPLARGKGSVSAVVVLDNSASMGALKDGRPVFSHACDAALRIFERLGEGDDGAVLPVCDAHAPSLVSGPARLSGMVGLTRLTNRDAAPDAAVAAAYRLLRESKSIHRELYVISDFQAGQWGNLETSPALRSPVGRAGPESAGGSQATSGRGIRTVLVPVASGSAANLFVSNAQVIRSGSALKRSLEFSVVNSSSVPVRGARVTVSGDGKEETVRHLDLAPFDSVRMAVEVSGSAREVAISFPPDSLRADDVHYVAVEAGKRLAVLVLAGEASPPSPDYLSLAMGVSPEFSPRRMRAADLTEQDLTAARCVILDNVETLAARELDLLTTYRRAGGGVLIALGDRVDIRHYNERLLPALLPARLVGIEGSGSAGREGGFFTLRAAVASHPILARFGVTRNEPVSGARFFEVVAAEPLDSGVVVAQFAEGLPALIEHRGALLFTSSLEPGWNELATSGAFVPLLHEMLGYLCGAGGGAGRNLRPGEAFSETLPAGPVGVGPYEEPGIYSIQAGTDRAIELSVNIS